MEIECYGPFLPPGAPVYVGTGRENAMPRPKRLRLIIPSRWRTCLRCGHRWLCRVFNPKVCPRCTSRFWKDPDPPRRGRPRKGSRVVPSPRPALDSTAELTASDLYLAALAEEIMADPVALERFLRAEERDEQTGL